jgi:hypothetical protein
MGGERKEIYIGSRCTYKEDNQTHNKTVCNFDKTSLICKSDGDDNYVCLNFLCDNNNRCPKDFICNSNRCPKDFICNSNICVRNKKVEIINTLINISIYS